MRPYGKDNPQFSKSYSNEINIIYINSFWLMMCMNINKLYILGEEIFIQFN